MGLSPSSFRGICTAIYRAPDLAQARAWYSHASGKDYAAEVAEIAATIRRAHPRARTVLDIACGTAEHARLLTEEMLECFRQAGLRAEHDPRGPYGRGLFVGRAA